MKKLITFTLGIAFLIPSLCWSLNSPTVVWPNQDGYYVQPGANQLFQVQTNVNNCVAYVTLYTINAGVKTLVETKEIKAKKNHNHVDLHIKIPQCLATSELCIGVRNKKGTSYSNEVFRYLTSSPMEISIPFPVPFIQVKCMDDPWEPIIPKGCKASLSNPTPDPTQNYNGLVHYFESFQNPFSDSPIATTNNGAGFSPYLLPYSPQQQDMGGLYKYTIPAPPCSPKGNLFNQMLFSRAKIPYTLLNFKTNQFVVNPSILPCSDKINCNLPNVTFAYLPSANEITIPGSTLINVKYYYDDNGQLHENQHMTDAGTILGYANPISKKIVCYDDLKEPNGTAVTRNYVIEYIVTTNIIILLPVYTSIPVTCKIRVPTMVTPINNLSSLPSNGAGQDFLDNFNSLMAQFGQLPGVNEKYICDLIFRLLDVIPNGIDRTDDVAYINNISPSVEDRYKYLIDQISSSGENYTAFWVKDNEEKLYNNNYTPSELGQYQLFAQDENGISIEIYSLDIVENTENDKLNLIDIIDDSLFQEFHANLPEEFKNVEGLKNEHSKAFLSLGTEKSTKSNQLLFETKRMNWFETISINPNPVKNEIILHSKSISDFTGLNFKIFSIDGRLHNEGLILENNSIETNNLVAGSYLIIISDDNHNIAKLKFTKE